MADGTESEIVESAVEIAPPHNGGAGFGLERLTMARNDQHMSWDDGAKAFKQAVEAEAQRWHRACDAAQDEVKQLNANIQGIKALAQQQVAQAEAIGARKRRLACTS